MYANPSEKTSNDENIYTAHGEMEAPEKYIRENGTDVINSENIRIVRSTSTFSENQSDISAESKNIEITETSNSNGVECVHRVGKIFGPILLLIYNLIAVSKLYSRLII